MIVKIANLQGNVATPTVLIVGVATLPWGLGLGLG